MIHASNSNSRLQKTLKRSVLLFALLAPISVFAQVPVTSLDDGGEALNTQQPANGSQPASNHHSVSQNRSSFRKASAIDLSKTPKVSKDDFGRLLLTVRQPKDTRMVWLGNKARAYRPPMPKTTWLGRKGPSE
jgi:hypothetical protein